MKKLTSLLLAVLMVAMLCTPAFAATTIRSKQALTVDGEAVKCDIYNIDGSNYFKLRDLALLMNGTGSQFAVGWDAATSTVAITTGQPYEKNGSELVIGEDLASTAQVSAQTILIDGKKVTDLSVYNIGGNNFFKLRDLGAAVGFDVDYDEATKTMIVESVSCFFDEFRVLVGKKLTEAEVLFPKLTWRIDESNGAGQTDCPLEAFYPDNDISLISVNCLDKNNPEIISNVIVHSHQYSVSNADGKEQFAENVNRAIEIIESKYGTATPLGTQNGTVDEFLANYESGKVLGMGWGNKSTQLVAQYNKYNKNELSYWIILQ